MGQVGMLEAEALRYLVDQGVAREKAAAVVKFSEVQIGPNQKKVFAVKPDGTVDVDIVPTEDVVRPRLSRVTDFAQAIRSYGDVLLIDAADRRAALQVIVDGLVAAHVSWWPGMKPASGADYEMPTTRAFSDLLDFVEAFPDGADTEEYSEFVRENAGSIAGASTILDQLRSVEIQVRRCATLGDISGVGSAVASVTVKQGDSESTLQLPKGFFWSGPISLDDAEHSYTIEVRTTPRVEGAKLLFSASLEDEQGLKYAARVRVQELIAAALSDVPGVVVLVGA